MKSLLAIAVAALGQVTPSYQALSQEPTRIGTNMEWVEPRSSQIVFVDVMKRSSRWYAFELADGGQWDTGAAIPMDDQGYPLALPYVPADPNAPAQGVFCFIFEASSGHYPSGNYTLVFEGSGLLVVGGANGEQAFTTGGTYTIPVDASLGDLYMSLISSDSGNRIRNIRLILPGFEGVYETAPFYPPTIAALEPFSALRLVQAQRTNGGVYPCDNGVLPTDGTCVKTWENRTLMSDRSQALERGVALEYLIDFLNAADIDGWFNIPHGADDDYVTEFARLVAQRLDPHLVCHLELSNEVWNPAADYPQSEWATNAGLSQGLSTNPVFANIRFVARRSAEIFRIFESEFGSSASQRLIKILPGFFGDPWRNDQLLLALEDPQINPPLTRADAVAVGSYFGYLVVEEIFHTVPNPQGVSEMEVLDRARANLTVDRPDPFFPGEMVPSLRTLVQGTAAVAQAHGVDLVAYEGGQHLVQLSGWNNDPLLGQTVVNANRNPVMYDIYQEMFDLWEEAGGGLFMHFSFVRPPSIFWGSFGSLEWVEQPLSQAPKHRALLDRIQGNF